MNRGKPNQPGEQYLVTGATGFAGGFLADALAPMGVLGLSRSGKWPASLDYLEKIVDLRACNLAEDDLLSLLQEVRPTRIYHLAGFSHAGQSVRLPEAAWLGNFVATERLLEAIRQSGLSVPLLYVSSGHIYGRPEKDVALDENSPIRPESPYAESKAAADELCRRYHQEHGLDIVIARPFNHTGPHQSPSFAIASFAQQVAAIAAGAAPPVIETGNLDVERDICDVRDVVAAYLCLMDHGVSGEVYNVGSERSVTMRWVLQHLIRLANIEVEIRPREDLIRAGEPVAIRVNASKLRQLGWTPQITLEETLASMLAAYQDSGGEA